jgi:hypothetical protein
MSPVAIAKMMRDSEVPASSGLRSSLPSAAPAPPPPPPVVAAPKEAAPSSSKAEDAPVAETPAPAAPEFPPPPAAAVPPTPRAAFPEWIPATTPDADADERLMVEQRLRLLHRAAAVAVLLFAAMTGLIIWLLTR